MLFLTSKSNNMNSRINSGPNSKTGTTFKKISLMYATKFLGGILLWMGMILCSFQLHAQISNLQTWSNLYNGTSNSQNLTYAVPSGSNSNRLLVVAVTTTLQTAASNRTISLTYGGRSLTLANGDLTSNTQQHTAIYYLNESNLDLASNTTLAFTATNGTTRVNMVWAAVYDYVNQTTPINSSQSYNSGTSTTSSFNFGTSLSLATGNQGVLLICSHRTGSTNTRTITYPTNWTLDDGQTYTTTDAINTGVAERTIPNTTTTDNCATTLSNSSLASMTAISINGCTQPTANVGSALSAICIGGTSAALGGSVGGSATGGTWSDGGAGGSFSPNANTLNATYTPASSFTGTVTLTLTTSGGSCGVATASKTLVVNPYVSASVSIASSDADNTICAGTSVTFTATPTNGGTASYLWKLNSGFVGTNSPTYTTSALANNDVVSVIMTSSASCVTGSPATSNSITSTIISVPTAPTGTAGSRCGTGTVSLSATPGSGETIDWYAGASGGAVLTGGTGVSSFTTPSISATTTYYAQARNTTTGCVSATRTAVIATVNAAPTISNQTSNSVYGNTASYNIVATGATSYTAASLPTGFSLNSSTGALSLTANAVVGVHAISITVSNAGGCTATATLTYTRTAKALTVTGATTTDKVYDGNTTATVTGGTLVGVVGSDVVTLTQAGTFANKNIGTNKAITSACSISGTDAGNYTLTQPTLTARNITAKALTVSGAVASNKVYNGNTTAVVTGGVLDGVISPDVVNLTQAGTFADKNVGNGKLVTATCSISGAGASNYTLTQPTGLVADITEASLTITANNQVKCYGNAFSIGTTAFSSTGLISGDAITSVTLTSDGSDVLADPGTYPIVPSAATGVSFNALNYNITYTNGTLTVSDIPSFSVNPSTSTQAVCLNQTATALSVTASAGSGTISSYQWYRNTVSSSFGGTLIAGATNAIYTPATATAGVFYYYCVVTNSFGCSLPSSASGAVTINALPTIVSVTGGGTVCNNTLLNASNGSSGTIYYQGATSGGISTTTPSTSQLISVTGTYYFRAQSAEGCWGPEGSALVTIQAPVVTGVEICQGGTSSAMSTSFSCPTTTGLTAGANDATSGTGTGWTSPGNIGTTGVATISIAANTNTTNLQGSAYGFNIPSYATIIGISVTINRQSSSTSTTANIRDNIVSLVKGGTVQTTNKATTTMWTNSLATATYGSASDLWGSTWTPADINATNFGVVLSVFNPSTSTARTASVDYIKVTVTYSTIGSLNWYTVSSGGSLISSGSSFDPTLVSGSGISNTNTAGSLTYYVECSLNPGCRGSGNFIINALPNTPTPGNASRCEAGTLTISATPASGETIDWYAAASGGSALLTSSNSYTTPSISATTIYYAQARNTANGCLSASRAAVTATVKAATSSSSTVSVCDSYSWNGNNYTSSGIYSYQTTNAVGCDSIAILNLTITASTNNTTTTTVCDTYTWAANSQVYTASGNFTYVSGCHTEYLNLTIISSTNNTTTESTCDSYTWAVNGQTYTSSGSYTSASGCNTQYLNLTITSSSNNTTTASVCDTYTWVANSQVYTNSGNYSFVNGCHTEYLNLTITASTNDTTTASVCDSYTWSVNSQAYTSSGIYSVVSGCHTDYLNLTVNTTTNDTTDVTACGSYLWSVNGQTYSSSGTYTSVTGCATKVLNLTITNLIGTNASSVTNCDEYYWSVNGQTYTASGSYTAISNCVQEILNLTINKLDTTQISQTACGSYVWYGTTYTSSGDYSEELDAANGCDSVVVLHLTINPLPSAPGSISGITEVCSTIGSSTPTMYSIVPVSGAATYTWTVPAGATIASGQNTSAIGVTFANTLAATNQRIIVTAVSASGCQSSTSSSITLSKTVPGIPTISGPSNACPLMGTTTNAVYTCDSMANASSYTWTVPTGATIISGQGTRSLEVRYGSNFTIGTITVATVSNCGSRSPRAFAVVRLTPTAPVAINGPTSVCSYIGNGQQVTYSVTPVANATGYTWTLPSNVTLVSGQGTNSIVVTFAANYSTSYLKVKSVSNCFTSGDRQLQLSAATYAGPGSITGPTNACYYVDNDASARYSIRKVANVPSYIWTVPAGVTVLSHPGGTGANDTAIIVSFNSNFVFGSQILVQTAGCGASAPRAITITGTLTSLPGLISGPTNVCEFVVSASNPNGNIATYTIPKSSTASYYSWTAPANATIISHPGGTGENDTIVQVKFSDIFTYGTLKVKSGNSCGISSDRTLSISKLNPSTPSYFDVVELSDCPSRIYSYSVSSMPMNATSIVWTVPTGATILSGQGTTSIVVSYSPSISVGFVTAQGINNCSSSSIRFRQIKLPACATAFTSTAPTNKVGGEIIEDEIGVSVFPNPTTTSFNVKLKTSLRVPVTVKVMDIQGRFVKSYLMNDASQFSFGNDLKPGSYLIEFIQGDKKKVQRLMKF